MTQRGKLLAIISQAGPRSPQLVLAGKVTFAVKQRQCAHFVSFTGQEKTSRELEQLKSVVTGISK